MPELSIQSWPRWDTLQRLIVNLYLKGAFPEAAERLGLGYRGSAMCFVSEQELAGQAQKLN